MEDCLSSHLPEEADLCLCGQGNGRVSFGQASTGRCRTRGWGCTGSKEKGTSNGQGGDREEREGCSLVVAHQRLSGPEPRPILECVRFTDDDSSSCVLSLPFMLPINVSKGKKSIEDLILMRAN